MTPGRISSTLSRMVVAVAMDVCLLERKMISHPNTGDARHHTRGFTPRKQPSVTQAAASIDGASPADHRPGTYLYMERSRDQRPDQSCPGHDRRSRDVTR